ncbi:hypothetical protein FLX08_07405 [Microbispora hainanensis]|uniref:Uncharacterized protein n=1 Tax=Microbispora hainanensis TaxID=568844 RepID=A0A544Z113_9ACTN|nr:hypothetical protein FLX08_07405 [Microbispora hainanensis]
MDQLPAPARPDPRLRPRPARLKDPGPGPGRRRDPGQGFMASARCPATWCRRSGRRSPWR